MAVRMKRPGKRVLALLGILAVFAAGCIGFTGCRGGSGDTEKIRDLEFTVTGISTFWSAATVWSAPMETLYPVGVAIGSVPFGVTTT